MSKYQAFTLIEILVVATIIIVLTSIGIASFSTATKSARDAKRKSDLETVKQALVLRKTQTGKYSSIDYDYTVANAATIIQSLVTDGYLSPPAPQDPRHDPLTNYTYVGNGHANDFCFCSAMEITTKGNHSNKLCSGSWSQTGQPFYCVRQP